MIKDYFLWYKSVHVIAVISWMAAILYLPRIFVYHAQATVGSEMDLTFKIMEHRLLNIIMTPAMLLTYIFGIMTSYTYGSLGLGKWFYIKILAVFGLTIMHAYCFKWVKNFRKGKNEHSEKFFRIVNEIPTIFMIITIIMVIVKPF